MLGIFNSSVVKKIFVAYATIFYENPTLLNDLRSLCRHAFIVEQQLSRLGFLHVCRSIQKLEELNVGMDDLGEDVQALTQQCNGQEENGNGSISAPSDTSSSQGDVVVCSTPQKTGTGVGRGAPPVSQSPVRSPRSDSSPHFLH